MPVNATLSALDRAGAATQAAAAVAAGFKCLKVKVGIGDDAGRVAAVRAAAGPEIALRLDANGAWSVEEAVRAIEVLAPAGLELVEEPTHGLEAVREVRERVPVRVSIDETAAEHGALGAGVADAVCLKISPLRRDLRPDRGRYVGARLRRGGLPRLHARRPAGGGRRGACRRGTGLPGSGATLRPGDARAVRGSRESAAGEGGEIALPAAGGLGVEPL